MSQKYSTQVEVLDLSGLQTRARDFFVQQGMTRRGRRIKAGTPTWAIVHTSEGIYAIACDGTGPANPITSENQLQIYFSLRYVRGQRSFGTLGEGCTVTMDDQELRSLPVKERMSLADFVDAVSRKGQKNLRLWEEHFQSIAMRQHVAVGCSAPCAEPKQGPIVA